jgi:hypothetical protein
LQIGQFGAGPKLVVGLESPLDPHKQNGFRRKEEEREKKKKISPA